MSRTTELAACALALCVAAACGSADARSTDRTQPMDIEAAHSDCGLGANGACTLTGNVSIIQGTLHITAAKAVVQQNGGNPSRALLSGGVRLQQDMDDGDRLDATSTNIDYDMRNEVMVFTGNVVIHQQRGSLNGERVVYNMKTGQVESGGDGSGRVKMRILPKGAPTDNKGTP